MYLRLGSILGHIFDWGSTLHKGSYWSELNVNCIYNIAFVNCNR